MEKLDEAANFLMMVSDSENGLENTCQISPGEALNMLQPLHAMLDEELKKGPHNLSSEVEARCAEDCHCGMYADLAKNKMMKDKLFLKAQSISKSEGVKCANKTAKWFCKSKLMEKLKSEIQNDFRPADAL